MFLVTLLVSIFLVTVGLIWWPRKFQRQNGFKPIPGPVGVPLIGNMFQIGKHIHIAFSKWANQYGKIFQVHLGTRRAVVISDPKWIKEMFSHDLTFTGRQIFEGMQMYENEELGIVTTEGELWEVHRRFLLRQLRDFGFGKSSMEHMILDEVKETLKRLRKQHGKSIHNIRDFFQIALINSLWMIIGSKRFNHDDPQVLEFMRDSDKFMQVVMERAITFFVPWTRYFLPGVKELDILREKSKEFYKAEVDFHKATLVPDSPRDFIDAYLVEMEAQQNNSSSVFFEKQLLVILSDIFIAGADTTSTTLTWVVLYLCKHLRMQKKLQDEIDKVVGNSRHVTLSDRPSMPYTMAIIEETLRHSSIVPTGIQHRATTGKEFKGYFIPENTWIFPNLYYIHHSHKIWGEHPEIFRPERFLSTINGNTIFKRNENCLPFVIGRRQCIGESLARDSFFLFLTNMFQIFNVRFDQSQPAPSEEPRVGFFLSAQPFSILLEERVTTN